MYSIISDYRNIDRQQWLKFVINHPLGNVFQIPEMVELYEQTNKMEPLVVACRKEGKDIVGILVAVVQKEYRGILGKLCSRAIVWGGPLVLEQNTEIINAIIIEFDRLCRRRAVYSQFRNLWNTNFMQVTMSQRGYSYNDHLDIHFDLSLGVDALWQGLHPTRRKQINRSQKRGVRTILADNIQPKELEKCHEIISQVYRKAKLPYPEINYFKNAFNILSPKGYVKAILAYHDEVIIGFRFILCYKEIIYDWYAGSDSKHHDKYPNDILPWEVMKWGAKNGYRMFDFGGAGRQGIPYGVRDYKIKFGGNLVGYGRIEKSHRPIMMILSRTGYFIWKHLHN